MRKKTRPQPPPPLLDSGAVPWLLACALATTAPHLGHLPYWLGSFAAIAIALRAWLLARNGNLPPRWLTAFAAIAAAAGIYLQYRTLFGRDAGVALLVVLMAMKPLESRDRRDGIVIVMLGFFLLLTHYFYAQGIPTGLWLMTATTLQVAALIRIFGGGQPAHTIIRHAGLLLLQATPFMVILFLLFPRVDGPLWGLPQDAYGGTSGLPDTIQPGSISDLVLNGNIAFRVRFHGAQPANERIYWRGPVMDEFDGRSWRPARTGRQPGAAIDRRADDVDYEITMEAHNQRWLLALDAPREIPEKAFVSGRMQVIAFEPIRQRSRYAFRSSLTYRFNAAESDTLVQTALRLPAGGNPRARTLAAEWRARHADPTAIVNEALRMFGREQFSYTLHPPLLGENSIDEFLFETKNGFCEHYASAFTFLMRAAGVPARVVAGYQGGELNPVDGYFVVRQSDAHAWAEVWIAGQGWKRVDPTAATAPSRIEGGVASALPEDDTLPLVARLRNEWLRQIRFRWDAINNGWNQWVLGYNPERQLETLARFGFESIDWRGMAALLAAGSAAVLSLLTLWAIRWRPRSDPVLREWLRFCARLARTGLPRHPWEGPQDYARRVAKEKPSVGPIAEAAAAAYAQARYGQPRDNELSKLRSELRAARRQLPSGWNGK